MIKKTNKLNSKCQSMAFINYPWSSTVQTNMAASHPPSSVRSSTVAPLCLCSAQHEGGLVAEIKQDHQLSASCFPRTRRWQLEQGNMMCCPLSSGEGLAHDAPSLHPFTGWRFISAWVAVWLTYEFTPISFKSFKNDHAAPFHLFKCIFPAPVSHKDGGEQ